jgi:hypothetical protein
MSEPLPMEAEMNETEQETLVVAARTAEHPGLAAALRRVGRRRTGFTLLVPALPSGGSETGEGDLAAAWAEAMASAERAAHRLRDSGLDLRETIVGDADCAAAIGDVLHARRFDEVLLATPQWADGEAALKLQRITNTSLRFRSPRLGALLRGRESAGVILDSRNTANRWRDDARTRTSRSAPARAGAALRSSS